MPRSPRFPTSRRTRPRPALAGDLPPPPRNWTTVKDTADRCTVSLATAYRWCERGQVVCRRVGSSWRVRLASDGFPLFTAEAV
ncbi:helix-turn-helix domain-containing protein [Corallococcus silvisoli]|uniref:helix-turn-helix domain-containing protein n=1 Tax=Corallococcus silvisoli TaxID=2697031 RepID=UPI0013789F5A|nr:helix-turn-helix domain-containing protein [Corallococcus silvisoli]NBD09641.1 helix-turn-helix domain-containing protein [Corallococcus silvisoli]